MGTVVLHPQDCLKSGSSNSSMMNPFSSAAKGNKVRKRDFRSPLLRQGGDSASQSPCRQRAEGKLRQKPNNTSQLTTGGNRYPLKQVEGNGVYARLEGGKCSQAVNPLNSSLSSSSSSIKGSSKPNISDDSTMGSVRNRSGQSHLPERPRNMSKPDDGQNNALEAANGANAKKVQNVVILKRPESKEAADQLLASFCKKAIGGGANAVKSTEEEEEVTEKVEPPPSLPEAETITASPLSFPSSPTGEGWAGPAFSMSPPPSSLPLPKFLRFHRSASMCSVTSSQQSFAESSCSSPPPLLQRFRNTTTNFDGCIDYAFATRDLRRILNLDA